MAFLYGPVPPAGGRQTGVLSTGTITAANLVGPLAGHPLARSRRRDPRDGTYVNVHTNDGVAPIGKAPGDFPGGEIRAQLIE